MALFKYFIGFMRRWRWSRCCASWLPILGVQSWKTKNMEERLKKAREQPYSVRWRQFAHS
jgi:hypothetical protein